MIAASKLNEIVQLAEASYTFLESVPPGDDARLATALENAALEGEFSEVQARALSQNWSLLHHLPNTASGFSATLFSSKTNPSELVLAIRGTEFDQPVQAALDLGISDIGGVVLTGVAFDQIVDLYNHWKRLTAPENSTVRLGRVVPTSDSSAPGVFMVTSEGTPAETHWRVDFFSQPHAGLGKGTAPISSLTVTGHSLGGHLATAFQRLFASELAIEVVTVNGMGTGEGAVVSAFFDELAEREGAAFDIARIANAFGTAGPNVAAGELLYTQYGDRAQLFTENVLGAVLGHGSKQMSDSAAVYDLFLRADVGLAAGTPLTTAATLLDTFKAAAPSTGFTLESIVNALGKVFVPDYVLIEPALEDDRAALHDRVHSIRVSIPQHTLTLSPLVGQTVSEAVGRAQAPNGLAYRYSLQELNPFAILGPDWIYAQHNPEGNLELFLTSEQTPSGMTNQYIADRAEFFVTKNAAYLVDTTSVVANQPDNWTYVDLARRVTVTTFGQAPAMIRRLAAFGAESADAVNGGAFGDRLYGGPGADVLAGGKSNDYLEGGAGMDVYAYSAETSVLSPSMNDGDDEVRDTDGRGVLRYAFTGSGTSGTSSLVIGGVGIRQSPTQSQSPDGKFTYEQQFEGLLVRINGDAGGTIRILDFDYGKAQSTGYMGIRLIDAPSPPGTIARTFFGDKQDWDTDGNSGNGIQTQLDAFGNVVPADGQDGRPELIQTDRADTLYGSAADEAERFLAGGGNDVIYADGLSSFSSVSGGRDLVEAGAGRDIVTAGAGNDWVEGGSGGDVLGGNLGDDALFGDSTNGQTLTLAQAIAAGETGGQATVAGDFITGDGGNDVIVGSAIADLIYGGEGADVIAGGAGADNIFGDGVVTSATLDWAAMRSVTVTAGVRSFILTTPGVVVSNPLDVGTGDVIYGGTGADWIFAGAGDDYVEGGNSAADANVDDDVIFGEVGSDILVGGSGKDSLHGDSASVDNAVLSGDDYLDGGSGDDQLVGYNGDDILIGGDGADTLDGGHGSNVVWGGSGNDTIIQGTGKDTYIYHRGDGADRVLSPASFSGGILALGSDITRSDVVLRLGSVIVDFGNGDAIHFESTDPVNLLETPFIDAIHFADGDVMTYAELLAQGFVLEGTELSDTLVGTPVRDRIEGKGGGDRLLGHDGDDSIEGGDGWDAIEGGAGDDTLNGGLDADAIDGGAGNDVLNGSVGDDFLSGGDGDDSISGGADRDFLDAGAGSDTLSGGSEADEIRAGEGDDEVTAGDGGDSVHGGSGRDALAGDAGDDSLEGGEGDDTLRGGSGSDLLVGGLGSDTYAYGLGDGSDVIHDQGGATTDVDVLVFGSGIGVSDVSFSRGSDNDLVARLLDGSTITVPGMFGSNRLEQLRFADGTALDAATFDALPANLVAGTEGADDLVGSAFADTLEGRGGDDTLAGGTLGDDTLIGGAGVDRYGLGFHTNRDVVVEAAGDTSVVVLDAGLRLNDIRVARNADDLVVTVRGTEHSLSIRDHFLLGGTVTVSAADGEAASAEALITVSEQQAGARQALKDDAWVAARARFFTGWMQHGLHPVDETTLARHHYEPFTASFAQNNQTITTTHIRADASTTVLTSQVLLTDWDYVPPFGFIAHTIAQFVPQFLESDDAVIAANPAGFVEVTPSQRMVEFDWRVLTSHAGTGSRVDVFPVEGGFIKHEYSDNFYVGTALGSMTDAPADAVELPENIMFPRYKLVGEGTEMHTQALFEVLAGASDNTILGAYIADGGAGNDAISIDGLALGGDGDDSISGGAAIYGEAGDDRLWGAGLVDGGSGNDVLRGGGILLPGSGNDLMVGESASTIFRIRAGDTGEKIIHDTGSDGGEGGETAAQLDRLELPALATLERLTLSWSTLDPLSQFGQEIGEARDTLDLSWSPHITVRIIEGIERVRFGDGTELTVDELAALAPASVITGTQGDEELWGTTRADTIWGLGGNDALAGGRGDDTYAFDDGFGVDLIDDHEGDNRIRFGASISPEDLTVTRSVSDLMLSTADDSVRILGWFADSNRRMAAVEFEDGPVWSADMVESALVTSTEGDDTLEGTDGSDVIEGGGGDDTIAGLAGDDLLDGGPGKDTYVFQRGDGADTVADASSGAEASVIVFGPDIFTWDIRLGLGSLVLGYTQDDAIHFSAFDAADPYSVPVFERLDFADGSTMTYAEVLELGIGIFGADGDDVIEGTALNDYIEAGAGNDLTFGFAGADNLDGGEGDDTLFGGAGDGDGMAGGEGSDTYVYAKGDGFDYLFEWDETPGDPDTLQLVGITPADVRVTRDEWSYHLVLGGTDRLVLDSMARESAAEIERIDFGESTLWTPADLAARVELLPGTVLDDALWGSAGNDTLAGLEGDDFLYGNAGDDLLIGGDGSDFYSFGAGDGDDTVDNLDADDSFDSIYFRDAASIEATIIRSGEDLVIRIGDGSDLVRLAGWYADASRPVNEVGFAGDGVFWDAATLEALAVPDSGGLFLVGTEGRDLLAGQSGDDTLDGAGGADTMVGGLGNDTYVIDARGDRVIEQTGEGADTVETSVTYTLPPNVERLLLGGTAAIKGNGNALDNVLVGNASANRLDGAAGADTLIGGAGNDTYIVDDAADAVIELADQGTDRVEASVSYSLAATVENLVITGNAAVDGIGNDLDNVLTGNAAANRLFGGEGDDTLKGGGGGDWLAGGAGDDAYVLADADDLVIEVDGEGLDTVRSAIGHRLAASVENLTLTGTQDINGFGNELDNVVRGNTGRNFLVGEGGDDTIAGNLSNDVIQGGAGDDRLNDPGGNNILDGGQGADTLSGNAGNDLLAGGFGNDTVKTGAGADVVLFNRGDGQDTVGASQGADNTVSLGGGIRYDDLFFRKSGGALVMETGASEQITLNGWYSAGKDQRSVARLQIVLEASADLDAQSSSSILNHKVQTFDFLQLAEAFDQARVASPRLTRWALRDHLPAAHIGASDTPAFGGDLAYRYAIAGNFAGMTLDSAQETLEATEFGLLPQTLFPAIYGGNGGDALAGGHGSDFLAAGRGNDALATGGGQNVIAFNRGDGTDHIYSAVDAVNTLSLGGGIGYSSLSLTRLGDDLMLHTGGENRLVIKDWYGGVKNILNLQIVLEASEEFDAASPDARYARKVQAFDFLGVVGEFDRALEASPGLTSWAMTNALLQFHLSGADDLALGGDLAYSYGRIGQDGGISRTAARDILGAEGFGLDAQSLRPFAGLKEGFLRLA